jgi:TetR/AcrR family transcriptional repressor of nem operon
VQRAGSSAKADETQQAAGFWGKLVPVGPVYADRYMTAIIAKTAFQELDRPMVRYSPDHKDKTRSLIVEKTAVRIRTSGLEGVGVASIMAEAGLTHGGFYAHFKSRDALLAAAVAYLFEVGVSLIDRFEDRHGAGALDRYLDFYLSPRHRDDLTGGCPVPVLSAEVQRAAPEVQAAFGAGLTRLADRLGKLLPTGGRKAALALLGEMAGVLNLSRAVADAKVSDDLLAEKRKAIAAA